MQKVFQILACTFNFYSISQGQQSPGSPLGTWSTDSRDMPVFYYTGVLPFTAELKNGEPALIADDPYFLLGNYRFKLFAHVSGEYEINSTERAILPFGTGLKEIS